MPHGLGNERFSARAGIIEECFRDSGLGFLPNDLTRMLYLASLRDCNSGRYLHPTLSERLGNDMADEGLRECHIQTFWRLLTIPISDYVTQVEEYIRYTRMARTAVLQTWHSLQAYRATTPVLVLPLYREIFCFNVEVALMVLRAPEASDKLIETS
jgi:hypothetical protein